MKLFIRSIIILALISLLILLFISLTGCKALPKKLERTESTPAEKTVVTLVESIREEMETKGITGLSIVVANSEGLIWEDGFGLSDKKNMTGFTGSTISNVGSVSKLVTSAALMRLVESGLVNLDEPVSTYIPEFDPVGSDMFTTPITVRMLLNHESGLESDAFRDFFLGYERPEDFPVTYRKAIEAVNASGVVRDPYEIFSYCNLGYSLLGIIIERAVGANFQQSVKELIFDPLGMNDSSFNIDDIPEGRMATGYLQGKATKLPYIRDMPAGSLNSTSIDMGRFLQGILASYHTEKGLLSQQTIHDMFRPSNVTVVADLDFQIGLTWWIVDLQDLCGEFVVGHGGDLPPYHALVIMLPDRDLSVFVMVNSIKGVGSFSLTRIVTETVRTFLDDEVQETIPHASDQSPIIDVPASLKSDLVGYYASPVGLSQIKESGDSLKIYTFNTWFDAYYHKDNTFTLGYRFLGLLPLRMPVFDEIAISLEKLGDTPAINLRVQNILLSPAVKIEPTPIDPAWIARIGTYESAETEVMPQYTDFKIKMDRKSGFLCLNLKSEGEWSKFPLQSVDAHTAQLMGTGRSLGGFLRVNQDDTIRFQNYTLRKI